MQHLNTLWGAVSAASAVSELARQSQTFHFNVNGAVTFYLQAEHAEVRINRWLLPKIEVTAQLQVPFGWRLATDQDEAGVYVVAKRRAVVGTLSSANFTVFVPQETYLMLKLDNGRLVLEHLSGAFNLPPMKAHDPTEIKLLTPSSVNSP